MKCLCFGEILWDIVGSSKTIGGAPFNVCGHLSELGDSPYILSSVGLDDLGQETIEEVKRLNISDKYLKRVPEPTGCAFVTLSNSIPTYSFNYPCAWDDITLSAEEKKSLENENFDCIVYGTLALRESRNRDTLLFLLNNLNFKEFFFDVNLRLNFYSKETLLLGLEKATMLKLNNEEEVVLKEIFNLNDITELYKSYPSLKLILLTLGKDGAVCYTRETKVKAKSQKIECVNTVGAGDSFSASFLNSYFKRLSIEESLKRSIKLASYVCQRNEAIPNYRDKTDEIFR